MPVNAQSAADLYAKRDGREPDLLFRMRARADHRQVCRCRRCVSGKCGLPEHCVRRAIPSSAGTKIQACAFLRSENATGRVRNGHMYLNQIPARFLILSVVFTVVFGSVAVALSWLG